MSYGGKATFIDTCNEQLRAGSVELLNFQVATFKPAPISQPKPCIQTASIWWNSKQFQSYFAQN